MKKTLLLIAIASMFACTEPEVIKAKASAQVGKYQNAVGRTLATCEGKFWDNNVYGVPGANPYGTAITCLLYNQPGTAGVTVQSYNITVQITNNSSNTLKLYKNGSYLGPIFGNGHRDFSFQLTCTCATNCPASVATYYDWTVTRLSGSGSSQVFMSTTVVGPHVISSGSATLVFN